MKKEVSQLVFLMETRLSLNDFEHIKWKIGFPHGLIVESRGRAEGLALLWRRDLKVNVKSYTDFHIEAFINEEQDDR